MAADALGEGEIEGEYEDEGEEQGEAEVAGEIADHELTHNEALAELMTDAASTAAHEGEAEAKLQELFKAGTVRPSAGLGAFALYQFDRRDVLRYKLVVGTNSWTRD